MKTREEMRFDAAKAAMQSIVLNPRWDKCHWDVIAEASVDAADCLLEQLDRTAPKPETPSPDADGWIEHRPGDPMPCRENARVLVRLNGGGEPEWSYAFTFDWNEGDDTRENIIAWKPAS